ncbi:hypothetical protein VP01_1111g7 [Puccinia sorghi]|uniref:Uncharacterized protein n=1 Tax=Puccinia sorghi TaxID=27349 RepID=A0A0L6VSL7_9BASI|nr:hypothetical protein VP01_1111g7 [Puccinia sorghi]
MPDELYPAPTCRIASLEDGSQVDWDGGGGREDFDYQDGGPDDWDGGGGFDEHDDTDDTADCSLVLLTLIHFFFIPYTPLQSPLLFSFFRLLSHLSLHVFRTSTAGVFEPRRGCDLGHICVLVCGSTSRRRLSVSSEPLLLESIPIQLLSPLQLGGAERGTTQLYQPTGHHSHATTTVKTHELAETAFVSIRETSPPLKQILLVFVSIRCTNKKGNETKLRKCTLDEEARALPSRLRHRKTATVLFSISLPSAAGRSQPKVQIFCLYIFRCGAGSANKPKKQKNQFPHLLITETIYRAPCECLTLWSSDDGRGPPSSPHGPSVASHIFLQSLFLEMNPTEPKSNFWCFLDHFSGTRPPLFDRTLWLLAAFCLFQPKVTT